MPTLGVPEWTIWSVQVFIRFILPESIENLKRKNTFTICMRESFSLLLIFETVFWWRAGFRAFDVGG